MEKIKPVSIEDCPFNHTQRNGYKLNKLQAWYYDKFSMKTMGNSESKRNYNNDLVNRVVFMSNLNLYEHYKDDIKIKLIDLDKKVKQLEEEWHKFDL